MGPGDIVVCFSDGVPDGVGPEGVDFGERKLIEVVETVKDRPPEEIVRKVMSAIDVHHGPVARQDDITLVIFKRTG